RHKTSRGLQVCGQLDLSVCAVAQDVDVGCKKRLQRRVFNQEARLLADLEMTDGPPIFSALDGTVGDNVETELAKNHGNGRRERKLQKLADVGTARNALAAPLHGHRRQRVGAEN